MAEKGETVYQYDMTRCKYFFYQLEKINQLAFTIVQRKPERNIL